MDGGLPADITAKVRSDSEIPEKISRTVQADPVLSLHAALDAALEHAKTLSEQVAQDMAKLGLEDGAEHRNT